MALKRHHKISLYTLLFIAVCCVLGTFVPWKLMIEHKLRSTLESKGFENVNVTISGLGLHEATLQNILIGHDKTISLKHLTLHYALSELWNGNLKDIAVDGLVLDLKQTDGKWVLEGYNAQGEASSGSVLPLTRAKIAALPFDDFHLSDARIAVLADKWHADVPFTAQWVKHPQAHVTFSSSNPELTTSSLHISAAQAGADLAFDEKTETWQGPWQAVDVSVMPSFPLLQTSGRMTAKDETATLSGTAKSADNIYSAAFDLVTPLAGGSLPVLKLKTAQMLWKKGTISVKNTDIALGGKAPIKFTVNIRDISVDELMQALTGKRVSATGTVSGAVPVVISPDGVLSFGQGKLQAAGAGTITMPPEALPGDNPQLELTRDILKNFHYQNLSIDLRNNPGGGIGLLLALQGNNPDVYSGRPVKLNVNLSGDVLDFIKENAMLMSKPETILQQDRK